MTRCSRFLAVVTLLALVGLASPSVAEEAVIGEIHIHDAFARATPPAARAGAAYMVLDNRGAADDVLIAAAADGVAARIELHEHVMDGGMMMMQEVEGGIPVPAGRQTVLEPGGLHVMLMGLTGPLVEGESLSLTLEFRTAGSATIEIPIRSRTAGAGSGEAHHETHDHE